MHEYKSKTLAKAFEEITGIEFNTTSSRKVASSRRCRPKMTGKNVYDGWIDNQLIGTRYRRPSI